MNKLKQNTEISLAPRIGGSGNRLFDAIDSDNLERVRAELANGADVNAVNEYSLTALMRASLRDRPEIVKLLIEKGANVNAVDQFGGTALMKATLHDNVEAIKILIKSGANINAFDHDGVTALMEASGYSNLDIVKLLIDSGADETIVNLEGYTARNVARTPDIYKYLSGLPLRKKVQNLSYVTTLGKRFGLNPNVEATIGSFLTGKKGAVEGQMNKLKQNSRISLAPRAGGTRKLNMKRRKTRRNRH
jgi:hypothetical protein